MRDGAPSQARELVMAVNQVSPTGPHPTSSLTQFPLHYCSVAKSCPTLCNPINCSMPGFPVFQFLPSLLKFMSIESMMPSSHLILCHPLCCHIKHQALTAPLPSAQTCSSPPASPAHNQVTKKRNHHSQLTDGETEAPREAQRM